MSTKDICRTINEVKLRSFCHFAFRHNNKTAKSWSEKRGCRNLRRQDIPCKFSYKEIYRVLLILVKQGLVDTFKGKGLDQKTVKHFVVNSVDLYRFWIRTNKEVSQ